MLRKALRFAKRQTLMLRFRGYELRVHTARLGKAMANPDDDFYRKHHRHKIQEIIHKICDSYRIRPDDMRLLEEDLNNTINRRVGSSFEKERQRRQTRECVDSRSKIKQMGE